VECPDFTPWFLGFTPKEHREILDRQKLLEWQATREDEDRRWRADEAGKDRAWREKQAQGEGIWRLVQVVVFGVVGAMVAILAALIERG